MPRRVSRHLPCAHTGQPRERRARAPLPSACPAPSLGARVVVRVQARPAAARRFVRRAAAHVRCFGSASPAARVCGRSTSYNQLTGSIPFQLGALTALRSLYAARAARLDSRSPPLPICTSLGPFVVGVCGCSLLSPPLPPPRPPLPPSQKRCIPQTAERASVPRACSMHSRGGPASPSACGQAAGCCCAARCTPRSDSRALPSLSRSAPVLRAPTVERSTTTRSTARCRSSSARSRR